VVGKGTSVASHCEVDVSSISPSTSPGISYDPIGGRSGSIESNKLYTMVQDAIGAALISGQDSTFVTVPNFSIKADGKRTPGN